MADFGLKYLSFAPFNGTEPENSLPSYSGGFVMEQAVQANFSPNLASAELYADNRLAEFAEEISDATVAVETGFLTDQAITTLFGASSVNDEIIEGINNTSPYGGLGYVKYQMIDGAKYYTGYFYPKSKASVGNDNASTKSKNTSFATVPTSFKVQAPKCGNWRYRKRFTTEADACLWIKNKLNIVTAYEVRVTGSGEGDFSPEGSHMVSAGSNFTLSFTDAPSALYDNGVDVTALISEGQYTISSIDDDHSLSVIYTA